MELDIWMANYVTSNTYLGASLVGDEFLLPWGNVINTYVYD